VFHSGILKSGTDFQIYREVQGLPGLDFAYMDNAAVYHTPVNVQFGYGHIWSLGFRVLVCFKSMLQRLYSHTQSVSFLPVDKCYLNTSISNNFIAH
jgi:hypothetical protein